MKKETLIAAVMLIFGVSNLFAFSQQTYDGLISRLGKSKTEYNDWFSSNRKISEKFGVEFSRWYETDGDSIATLYDKKDDTITQTSIKYGQFFGRQKLTNIYNGVKAIIDKNADFLYKTTRNGAGYSGKTIGTERHYFLSKDKKYFVIIEMNAEPYQGDTLYYLEVLISSKNQKNWEYIQKQLKERETVRE
ncbi:MAG: hypothetical protein FWG57_00600 [Endomicrobia bacterium]|nr:hypothetical protein [Endomicrobiia bacterium]